MKVVLFVPALVPLTFHWYAGFEPPLTDVAVNVTEEPAQTGLLPAAIFILTGINGFTVMLMALEVAGLPDLQVSPEVNCTVITSLLVKEAEVYVEPVAPGIAVVPLYHWKVGVAPPLTGVAVNVTGVPAQITPEGTAAILTLTGRIGFTAMLIPLEVAGLPDLQVSSDII